MIVSDDAEFSSAITSRWQSERDVPAFTVVSADLCQSMGCQNLDTDAFDIAIIGAVAPESLGPALAALDGSERPILLLAESDQPGMTSFPARSRRQIIRKSEGWCDALVLIAIENLRTCAAEARLHRLEKANLLLERQATLGRYIIEMRHGLNNALTSVLGNSELLLLDPGSLSAGVRSQIDTIRNMALRMHEVMRRFSSIEKELTVAEKQSQNDDKAQVRAAGANV
ncbi:MAG: hypothetical protein JOY93_03500 [Acidobacteriales bacterium]|nr:hypothetical protein [Terriglobales bacterium]